MHIHIIGSIVWVVAMQQIRFMAEPESVTIYKVALE